MMQNPVSLSNGIALRALYFRCLLIFSTRQSAPCRLAALAHQVTAALTSLRVSTLAPSFFNSARKESASAGKCSSLNFMRTGCLVPNDETSVAQRGAQYLQWCAKWFQYHGEVYSALSQERLASSDDAHVFLRSPVVRRYIFFKSLMMWDTLHSFVSQAFYHFDLLYFWFSLFLCVRIFVASTNLFTSFIHSSSYMSVFMYIFVLRWLCLLHSKRKCLDVSSAFWH